MNIDILIKLCVFTQQLIRKSQLKRWRETVSANSFSLSQSDEELKNKIIDSQCNQGFPNF